LNWIDKYLNYTKEHESVKIFHKWVGISCVASALSRKCWTRLGFDYIYPNMYIILVGPPAHPRKTGAMNVALDLIIPLEDEALLHTSSESVTMAKLYDDLHAVTESINIGEQPYSYSALMAQSTELGSFIKANEHLLVGLLIELYDCKMRQRHGTRSKGTVPLKNCCLNILGATTPSFFEGMNFDERVRTGFTSRCIFIYSQTRRFNKPDGKFSDAVREELVKELTQLSQNVRGMIPLSSSGTEAFNRWYDAQELTPDVAPVLVPYYGRKQTHVRKVAMLYTAMDVIHGAAQETTEAHVYMAIETLDEVEKYMIQAYKGAGRAASKHDIEDIIATIQNHRHRHPGREEGWLAKATIIKKHFVDIDPLDIVAILNTLYADMKMLERRYERKDFYYRWKGEKK
jgi:hypothetical protein